MRNRYSGPMLKIAVNGRSRSSEKHLNDKEQEWDWRELSRYFLRKATNAQRRMWALRYPARTDSTSRAEFDRALAVLSVCHQLWGKPFLRNREHLINELHGLLTAPKPEEAPFDEDRFVRMWRDVVTALIWRYRA
jgi:hypothetical protein